MTTIYLIRHGDTDWTGHRVIGITRGVHINLKGRTQAERIANHLQHFPIEALFSSPIERATDTAAPLADLKHLPVSPASFLCSIDFGEFQKKTGEELKNEPIWQQFLTHPAGVQFPGGEAIAEAKGRIVAGLNELSTLFPGNSQVACFSHCEILRLAISYALKMPLDDYMRLRLDPGSISCLNWEIDWQSVKMLNYVP
jgi:broad specificity phosphatase PhoE